jgi:hypothetical protein
MTSALSNWVVKLRFQLLWISFWRGIHDTMEFEPPDAKILQLPCSYLGEVSIAGGLCALIEEQSIWGGVSGTCKTQQ